MNPLSIFRTVPATDASPSQPAQALQEDLLQTVLMDLSRFGKPKVGQYGDDNTWHCHIEANISPIGAKFEVRSDWKQRTPLDAALQCRDRLKDAIKALGGVA